MSSVEPLPPRRWLILGICCLSLLIVSMDASIVNVALPAIRRSLHASVSGLQWTIDAYTLVLAALLMASGSTADRLGRRRVFQTGLALFTLGSLLCSLAPGLGWLVAFRGVQAIGGSMLNPVAMSIIVNTFSDQRERGRAIGIWGATLGVSLSLGPVVGGALVSGVGWRSIFWINIPIGIAAIVLTQLFVPESRAARPRRLDPVGQVVIAVMLGSLTYAIIEGPGRGWTSPLILGLFGLAVVAALLLTRVESRQPEPLIDLRFFRSAPFSGATVVAVCAFAAFGGFLFLNTLYLQGVRGDSALRAGLLTLPMALVTGLVSPLSGRLVTSRGARLPLVVSGAAIAVGGVLLAGLTPQTSVAQLFASYVAFGIGFGLVNAPITNTAMAGMPRAQAGVAAGVASSSRQVGSTLGVAVCGSIVAMSTGARFATASHAAWAVLAGCGVVIGVLGVLTTTGWAMTSATRTRELLDIEDTNNRGSLQPVG